MKMFDSKIIATPQAKFIEIGDKLVIDTNIYDSSSLSQIPYNQLILNNANTMLAKIITKKMSNTRYYAQENIAIGNVTYFNYHLDYNISEAIQDEYNSSIYYINLDYRGTNTYYLIKVSKNGNKIELLQTTSRSYARKYICQDADYLYFADGNDAVVVPSFFDNYASQSIRILKISKNNLATQIFSNPLSANAFPRVSYFDDTYIYISYRTADTVSFYRVKKIDLTLENTRVLFKHASSNNSVYRDFHINLITNGDFKSEYWFNGINSVNTTVAPGITHVKYDFSTVNRATAAVVNSVTQCTIDFTLDTSMQAEFEATSILASQSRVSFITKSGGKSYLSFFVHNPSNSVNLSRSGIFTFEVVSETSLKYVSRLKLDGGEKNPLFLGGDSITEIYVPSESCLYYLKFNDVTKSFYIVNSKPITVINLGQDNLGRIWAIDIDEQLHMFSESVVEKVNLFFENTNLEYTGSDINNNVLISCLNNSGVRVAFNVQLTINGNATFQDGSKIKTITTLTTGDLSVPIIIKGAGQVSIYPKIVL